MTLMEVPIAKLLPRVHPDTARVSRIAFDARFQRWMALLSRRRELTVVRRLPPDDGMLLDLEIGDGHVHVALDTRDWPALDMLLSIEDEAVACAAASALLTPMLNMLGADLGAPRVVRRTRFSATRTADSCAVIAVEAARVSLLRITPLLLERLHTRLAGRAARARQALGGLRLRPRLRLLERVLPQPVLAGLAPGDIVLLETANHTPLPLTFIVGKGMTMEAQATFDPNTGEAVATAGPALRLEPGAGPDDAAPLDELQVPVSFEVDSARVTLAELASIRPGYVIELERPLTAATVRLVCHGQTVGHGQLVAVGEQMGIRITRMGLGAAGIGGPGGST